MKIFALALAAGFFSVAALAAPVVTFTQKPASLQLYPRDAADSGTVVIAGNVTGTGYDSIVVDVKKAGAAYARPKTTLVYLGNTAAFSISVRLISELSEYVFNIYGNTTPLDSAGNVVCGDVWVIDGQSNAEASGANTFNSGEWVRSAGYSGSSATWGIADYSCCTSPGIGMVGASLGKALALSNRTPVCIINGAVSGTIIEAHQRNNSNPTDVATIYGRILLRAKVSGLINNIRAILYYQGEYHSSASTYAGLFDQMYKSWKSDYPALQKVYVMQVNAGCNESGAYNAQVREIQRKFGETYSDVTVMTAVGLTDFTGCHYGNNGYTQTGMWWYPVYNHDFYGKDSANITAPKILKAYFSTQAHTTLDLLFDMPVVWPADPNMKNGIGLGRTTGLVSSASSTGNVLHLNLSSASSATTVSYVPANSYMGPYLYSARGVGVLTFLDYPITANNAVETAFPARASLSRLSVLPNPFTPSTCVRIPGFKPGRGMTLKVYSAAGRMVADLSAGARVSGSAEWNAAGLPSGIYLVRLEAAGRMWETKAVLTR